MKTKLCRNCYQPIDFIRTASNKVLAVNPDGEVHAPNCPKGNGNRPPDDACTRCESREMVRLPGKDRHAGAVRCLRCGHHRWLRKAEV